MEDVILEVTKGKMLGMSICGGDKDSLRKGHPGIYIRKVFPNGLVASDGRLQEGDRICEINGSRIASASHDNAVSLIQDAMASGKVHLLVSRTVEKSQVTREEQFHGRHGLVRRTVSNEGMEVSYHKGHGGLGDLVVVEIERDSNGFGFELVGAGDERGHISAAENGTQKQQQQQQPTGCGVFISAVHAGTKAASHISLARGLQVLDVNGWQVKQATVQQVQEILDTCTGNHITLTLKPNPSGFAHAAAVSEQLHYTPYLPPDVASSALPDSRLVTLHRDNVSHSWGLRILGRSLAAAPNTQSGVFVSGVAPDSVAGRSNALRVGDQILEVNGLCMSAASHQVASHTLKSSGLTAKLLGTRPPVCVCVHVCVRVCVCVRVRVRVRVLYNVNAFLSGVHLFTPPPPPPIFLMQLCSRVQSQRDAGV